MKIRISKAEYDALSEAMKLIYVADGDGYKLPLAAGEDPVELKRAKDREVETAKAAKTALDAANAELAKLRDEPARRTGDIATLEKSWSDKQALAESNHATAIGSLKKQLESVLIDNAAQAVAGAITANPNNASVLMPHIKTRFEIVYDGDVPTVKIKDATGRISAMNTKELQGELVADPKFSSIVVVNRGSGAGGAGTGNTGGGSGAGGGKKFADMTGAEKTALYQSNQAEFARQAEAHRTAKMEARFGSPKIKIPV